MTLALPRPLHRMAALGLLGLTLLVLWLLILHPVFAHFSSQHETLERERVVLGRFLAAAGRQTTAGDMERRVGELLTGSALLKGESDPIRVANLQALVGEIAGQGNLRLRSVRALPRRDQGSLSVHGVSVQVATDLAGAQALIHRLESAETLLLITGVQMSRGAQSSQGPAEIDLRLDVLGVARKGGG